MIRRGIALSQRMLAALRAIRETEAFLSDALRHPEQHVRIPTVRVGYGSFPPGLAQEFWADVLGLNN